MDYEKVEVPMGDIYLRGGLFSYPKYDKDKLIILNHGMWSSIDAYMQDIAYFVKKGYQVLAINHEGVTESDGKNIRGLSNSLRSLDYVIQYVKKNEKLKNRSLYVEGHSWGGFAAINIPYYHEDIKGVLAISPFMSVKSCMKGLLPKPLWVLIPFFQIIEKHKVGAYAVTNAIKNVKNFKGNLVILHSENDNMVKFRYNTFMLMKQDLSNVSYMIFKDKKHNPHYAYSALRAEEEYVREISKLSKDEQTAFMEKTDFHKLGELDEEVLDKALELWMK